MHQKMGEARCQLRVDNQVVGGYSYIAGIVRLTAAGQSESVLVVQRCPCESVEGTPFTIVRPEEIPDEIKRHQKIAVWLDNTARLATWEEAVGLVDGQIYSYWHPSLGSAPPMFDLGVY